MPLERNASVRDAYVCRLISLEYTAAPRCRCVEIFQLTTSRAKGIAGNCGTVDLETQSESKVC